MGRLGISLIAFLSFAAAGIAAEVEFNAKLDRDEISLDESVVLKFQVITDGSEVSVQAPQLKAKDFDVVNSFNSQFMQSVYENGKFTIRNQKEITKVLRPKRVGKHRITGLSVMVDGKKYQSPPLTVTVSASGPGTPPPKGYGGTAGLRGSQKKTASRSFMIRAELSKPEVFQGEQLIVSYYMYRATKVFNWEVKKYPILNGFLRKDLELPVLKSRGVNWETVVLNGTTYQRMLLARYAAYPLRSGKLKIDSMSISANYYARNRRQGFLGDDDPFQSFFQNLSPLKATKSSRSLTVEVRPLPTEGKPANFSGGVGDFNMVSAVDRYEIRANEALKLTVKIEGRGNVAVIEEPSPSGRGWPDSLEVYDVKTNATLGRGGVGEKVFVFTLIPRSEGKLTIPEIQLSYFDPTQKKYVTRSTKSIDINVLSPAGGASGRVSPALAQRPATSDQGSDQTGAEREIRYLKTPGEGGESGLWSVTRSVGKPLEWIAGLCLLGAFLLAGMRFWRSKVGDREGPKASSDPATLWKQLREKAENPGNLAKLYENLTDTLFATLDYYFGLGARSLSRARLKQVLVDAGKLDENAWRRVEQLLEYAEMVQYSGASEDFTREQLDSWIAEGERLCELLSNQANHANQAD